MGKKVKNILLDKLRGGPQKSYTLSPQQQVLVQRKYDAVEKAKLELRSILEGLMAGVGLDLTEGEWRFDGPTMTFSWNGAGKAPAPAAAPVQAEPPKEESVEQAPVLPKEGPA